MKLTATPFDAQTGELLPVYRDAYLRGDLARSSAQAVEDYLRRDASEAHSVVTRWHHLQADENPAMAPNWVGRQLQAIREQPQRFRRRAASFVLVGALLAGATMAANLPVTNLAASAATVAASAASTVPELAMARTVVLHGRIMNEKGLPLAGATIMQKGTSYGTTTDADGHYSLRVPAGSQATLQYGYGGYTEQEAQAAVVSARTTAVVLQPKHGKRKHWFFF